MFIILYIVCILVLLLFLILFCIYGIALIISILGGAPYIPTNQNHIRDIFKYIHFKQTDIFLELGCGDGRVVRSIVKLFGVKGIGIDINPMLVSYADFLSKIEKLSIQFIRTNILTYSYKDADIIYMFLLPNLMNKIESKIENETKKGTIIISHRFKFDNWENKLIHTLNRKTYSTFIYKM
ncbi:MAG: class I SAM-dependent methyltransferase [Candidatus Roizmanbacteria bacterium]